MKRTLCFPALLAALLLVGAACGDRPTEHRIVPKETGASPIAGDADPGRAVFLGKGNCAICHGQAGTGSQIAPDLTDDVWLHLSAPIDAEAIEGVIRSGVLQPKLHSGVMPPMGGAQLSEEELKAVAAYVYALSHPTLN